MAHRQAEVLSKVPNCSDRSSTVLIEHWLKGVEVEAASSKATGRVSGGMKLAEQLMRGSFLPSCDGYLMA